MKNKERYSERYTLEAFVGGHSSQVLGGVIDGTGFSSLRKCEREQKTKQGRCGLGESLKLGPTG